MNKGIILIVVGLLIIFIGLTTINHNFVLGCVLCGVGGGVTGIGVGIIKNS